MSLLTASNELKNRFSQLMPFLKEDWKFRYLDFFTIDYSNEDKVKTYFTLVNIGRTKNPVSPSPTVLENIETLINKMGWN